MEDANYSNISKFHLGQIVCRKIDKEIPKSKAIITQIRFIMGGTVEYCLTWDDGCGGTSYEQEIVASEENELVYS